MIVTVSPPIAGSMRPDSVTRSPKVTRDRDVRSVTIPGSAVGVGVGVGTGVAVPVGLGVGVGVWAAVGAVTTTDATTLTAQAAAIFVMDGIYLASPRGVTSILHRPEPKIKGFPANQPPKRASGARSTAARVAGSIWKYSASRNPKMPAMMFEGTD